MSIRDTMDVYPAQDAFEELQVGNVHVQKECEYRILFPPEHEICSLWRLWTGVQNQSEPLSIPVFLKKEPAQAVSSEKSAFDHRRFQILLGYISRARLSMICHAPPSSMGNLDEAAFIVTSNNEMDAWLFLFPPTNSGKKLTSVQIHQALLRRGITYGIDWNFICELPEYQEPYFKLFHIASGTEPASGKDGHIIDRFPRVLDEIQVQELGNMNYETLNLVQDIRKGDVICEITPPTFGIPGRTVTGKMLPAQDGKPAEIPQGRNTGLSEDGRYLVAERDGHVCFSGRSFQVRPVLELLKDDIPTDRSVKFLGDVHIRGDLQGGISVFASGNIQIDGVVENCSVEAGENVIVSSGVQGQGHAVLHAQRSIYAKYLEQCMVCAQESVQADCIINCSIYCNGTVKARTGRGTIIGGTICAAQEVSAVTIGSKAERPTLVMLGGQPCEDAERAQIMEEIQSIERELTKLERLPKEPIREQKQSKLRLNQCVAKLKLEKIDKELEGKMAAYLEHDACRLICGTVYPGTTITIDHSSMRITQKEHNCDIGYQDGFVCHLKR